MTRLAYIFFFTTLLSACEAPTALFAPAATATATAVPTPLGLDELP